MGFRTHPIEACQVVEGGRCDSVCLFVPMPTHWERHGQAEFFLFLLTHSHTMLTALVPLLLWHSSLAYILQVDPVDITLCAVISTITLRYQQELSALAGETSRWQSSLLLWIYSATCLPSPVNLLVLWLCASQQSPTSLREREREREREMHITCLVLCVSVRSLEDTASVLLLLYQKHYH
jgi:hypothetical protein